MTEIQQLIKEKGGCPAFAKWSGDGLRKVQAWKAGEHAPRKADADRIVRLHEAEVVIEGVRGLVVPTAAS